MGPVGFPLGWVGVLSNGLVFLKFKISQLEKDFPLKTYCNGKVRLQVRVRLS